MNEHFLKLDYKEISTVKDSLKGIRWKYNPLLEPVNPVEYNLVMYSANKKEYFCAEGILEQILFFRKMKEAAE
jgi:hypothetical protein